MREEAEAPPDEDQQADRESQEENPEGGRKPGRAGAVGAPGQRAFYIQARTEQTQLTVLVEKEQVGLLEQELAQRDATALTTGEVVDDRDLAEDPARLMVIIHAYTEEQQREGGAEYNYRREAGWQPRTLVREAGGDGPVAEIAAMTGTERSSPRWSAIQDASCMRVSRSGR